MVPAPFAPNGRDVLPNVGVVNDGVENVGVEKLDPLLVEPAKDSRDVAAGGV